MTEIEQIEQIARDYEAAARRHSGPGGDQRTADYARGQAAAYRQRLEQARKIQATPRDFDGYLMIFVVGGEAPAAWRVTRDDTATCETCGKSRETSVKPIYRTVGYSSYDPQLGMCQDCVEQAWNTRMDDDEPADPTGARAHMFAPQPLG